MPTGKPSYFLVSLSNKANLNLCIRYSLAGFTNSISGVWTFLEIREGDLISFLYGAKAYNLYTVERKEALRNAERLPPWLPVTFRLSGRTYYFPFRLTLNPVRRLEESLVRPEFSYVAENLLLRGGYRKTHFQADQTTLQNASQMGSLWDKGIEKLELQRYETFVPKFVKNRKLVSPPEVFPFQEFILQALIRQYLTEKSGLSRFLELVDVDELDVESLEVLGEKALPEGHIDILIKEAVPIGISRKVIVEVKIGRGSERDLEQLEKYVDELGGEVAAGVLVARDFPGGMAQKLQMRRNQTLKVVKYNLEDFSLDETYTFEQLRERFELQRVSI
jgi:hypothetical protein